MFEVRNKTGSIINLQKIVAPDMELPDGVWVDVSLWNDEEKIPFNSEYITLVNADDIEVRINGELLSNQEAIDASTPPVITQISHDQLEDVSATDHHDNSNDPTSDQKDALDGAGVIDSGNPLVGQSVHNIHANSTSNPHDVTAAQVGAVTISDFSTHENSADPHPNLDPANIGAIPSSEKGAVNGVCDLDAGGKVPASKIPSVALPEVHIVADSTERLALTVQEGDEAKQTDDSSHWVYDGSTWIEYPSGGAGTGDVSGPGSSTDNAIARFDGAAGKIIQNSAVTIDDLGNIATSGTVDGRDVSDDGDTLDDHTTVTQPASHVGLENVSNTKNNVGATTDPGAGDDDVDGYSINSIWHNNTTDKAFICVDASTSNAVWKEITFQGISEATEYFDAYDAAGGTDISSGWTDVPLDTERKKDAMFEHTGSSAEVTFEATDTVAIFARVAVNVISGSSRSEAEMRMSIDTGSGYTEIAGMVSPSYARQLNYGGQAIAFAVVSVGWGDKIKIQARRTLGTSTINLRAGGSGLTIMRIRGQTGAQGPKGDTGSGSNITMERDTVTLASTPHSILDVVGDGVTFTDVGGGRARLNIPGGYDPESGLDMFDDFAHLNTDLWYTEVSGAGSSIAVVDGLAGQLQLIVGPVSGTNYISSNFAFFSVPGCIDLTYRARMLETSAHWIELGGQNNAGTAECFFFLDGTGNWFSRTRVGGSITDLDTGTAQDTNWHKFRIISTDGSTVKFYIDDVLKNTHLTNIPTYLLQGHVYHENQGSSARNLIIDWVRFKGNRES
jgi:hypothetical protein